MLQEAFLQLKIHQNAFATRTLRSASYPTDGGGVCRSAVKKLLSHSLTRLS